MPTTYRRSEKARADARLALLNEFVSLCEAGEVAGFATYGDFDPVADKRVLSREAIEEIRDAWNYMRFLELKRPELRSPIQKIRAKLVMLYGELRKLEEAELAK
ncbi:MAG: hypothetical protein WC736_15475 [Gallionella sp.]